MSADKKAIFAYYWRILGDGRVPVEEYKFDAHLGRKHRFDFAFIEEQVAVEVDGQARWVKGGSRHAQDSDREKGNIAASLGWRVLHFSPSMLEKDPEGCIKCVKNTLNKYE